MNTYTHGFRLAASICASMVLALTGCMAVAAAPCTADKEECIRSVPLAGSARGLVYSTYSLDERNDAVTRALIVVHGAGRNADNYFRSGVAAASSWQSRVRRNENRRFPWPFPSCRARHFALPL